MKRPPKNFQPVDADAQGSPSRPRYGLPSIALALVFGLLFAYVLFTAISNVVGVTSINNAYNASRVSFGLSRVAAPWVWLVIDLLLAPVFYAVAFFVGRTRTFGERTVLFLMAFAAVSAAVLTVTALA